MINDPSHLTLAIAEGAKSTTKLLIEDSETYKPIIRFCSNPNSDLLVGLGYEVSFYYGHMIAVRITWKESRLHFQIKDSATQFGYFFVGALGKKHNRIKSACNELNKGILTLKAILENKSPELSTQLSNQDLFFNDVIQGRLESVEQHLRDTDYSLDTLNEALQFATERNHKLLIKTLILKGATRANAWQKAYYKSTLDRNKKMFKAWNQNKSKIIEFIQRRVSSYEPPENMTHTTLMWIEFWMETQTKTPFLKRFKHKKKQTVASEPYEVPDSQPAF